VVASALETAGVRLRTEAQALRKGKLVTNGRLETALRGLGLFVGVAYVIVGIAGGYWPGHWDDAAASDQIVWVLLLVGGGAAVLAGLRFLPRSPKAGATLISLGAVLGALPIFWALLPLLLAVALIVLSVMYARRAAPPAAA
jgi:hypothetical protein